MTCMTCHLPPGIRQGLIMVSQKLKKFLTLLRRISGGIPQLLWHIHGFLRAFLENCETCMIVAQTSLHTCYSPGNLCYASREAWDSLTSSQNHSGQVPERWIASFPISRGFPELLLTPEICMPIPEGMSILDPDSASRSFPCVAVSNYRSSICWRSPTHDSHN